MADDKKILGTSETQAVSGGAKAASSCNLGGKCRHYICRSCGGECILHRDNGTGICESITVLHLNEMCPVLIVELGQEPGNVVSEGSCRNCKHYLGGNDCAIPND